jgi:RNA polymerase sigma-70 factor (ECF subfamily)
MGGPHDNEQANRFQKLVEPHFDRLFRLAVRLTGTRTDAEDLVQETLTRLFADMARLETVVDPGPYLNRVLYNRFVDDHRARKRRPLSLVGDDEGQLDQPDEAADPARLSEAQGQSGRLAGALARLSDEHRQLVLMHDAEGYTLRELEALTDTPIGTLKSRLSRARARLRELLWDMDDRSGAEVKKKREPFSANRRVNG